MKGCKKKNMLSFYWCRDKFGEFVLGKVELIKKRTIITIKQEEGGGINVAKKTH